MPKVKPTVEQKAKQYIDEFPSEFTLSATKELFCKVCSTVVNCEKAQYVENHRKTNKHSARNSSLAKQPKIAAENETRGKTLSERVTGAFLSADIPLKKISHPAIKELFASMNHVLPSESTCRNTVERLHSDMLEKIKKIVQDKDIFVVFDETSLGKESYSHTLIGLISKPETTYLIDSRPLSSSLNAAEVARIIDEVLKSFNVDRDRFCLFISDAARYMTAAGRNLKIFYPKMIHITCLAHLLHNCCLKIRSHFPNVDKLIATVKASTVRNKERRNLFKEIGFPPEPVLTRWGSWLSAAIYYAKNLVKVREIYSAIDDKGELVKRVKDALNSPGIEKDLVKIMSNYAGLIKNVDLMEKSTLGIQDAYKIIEDLNFEDDVCNIREYINKRLDSNEIKKIIEMTDSSISPAMYTMLLKCQATSCSVERSFSILNKLLAKDRNFKPEHVKFYVIVKFNSVLIK